MFNIGDKVLTKGEFSLGCECEIIKNNLNIKDRLGRLCSYGVVPVGYQQTNENDYYIYTENELEKIK